MHNTWISWVSLGAVAMAVGCADDPPGIPDAGTPLVDQCLSASDMELIAASRVDAGAGVDGGGPNPIMEAYACSLTSECAALYFGGDFAGGEACVNDCLDAKPSGGLSAGCRACFTHDAVNCAGQYCLVECVADPPTHCTPCFQEHCQTSLDACIGY